MLLLKPEKVFKRESRKNNVNEAKNASVKRTFKEALFVNSGLIV
jgi:hypothetical protein